MSEKEKLENYVEEFASNFTREGTIILSEDEDLLIHFEKETESLHINLQMCIESFYILKEDYSIHFPSIEDYVRINIYHLFALQDISKINDEKDPLEKEKAIWNKVKYYARNEKMQILVMVEKYASYMINRLHNILQDKEAVKREEEIRKNLTEDEKLIIEKMKGRIETVFNKAKTNCLLEFNSGDFNGQYLNHKNIIQMNLIACYESWKNASVLETPIDYAEMIVAHELGHYDTYKEEDDRETAENLKTVYKYIQEHDKMNAMYFYDIYNKKRLNDERKAWGSMEKFLISNVSKELLEKEVESGIENSNRAFKEEKETFFKNIGINEKY